jgi:hypothetical protein
LDQTSNNRYKLESGDPNQLDISPGGFKDMNRELSQLSLQYQKHCINNKQQLYCSLNDVSVEYNIAVKL